MLRSWESLRDEVNSLKTKVARLETELFELNVIKKNYIINLFYFNASWLYSLQESSMKLKRELDQTKDNLAKETNDLVNNLKVDIQKLESGLLEPNVN